jgi:hypothetical protein
MAVQTSLFNTSLSIRYKEGLDERGNDIVKSKKFSNVKVTAVSQDLFDVAQAFSPLLKYPVVDVLKTDESFILSM